MSLTGVMLRLESTVGAMAMTRRSMGDDSHVVQPRFDCPDSMKRSMLAKPRSSFTNSSTVSIALIVP